LHVRFEDKTNEDKVLCNWKSAKVKNGCNSTLVFVFCLKYRQIIFKGFGMKTLPIFPPLPQNLSIKETRKEIRRRLEILDRLGLIRKPKNDLRS
jgi:hypothetical protein